MVDYKSKRLFLNLFFFFHDSQQKQIGNFGSLSLMIDTISVAAWKRTFPWELLNQFDEKMKVIWTADHP